MAAKYGVATDTITDFSANINPHGMPDSLRQALIAQLDCIERYPDIDYLTLHQAIAAHHNCPPAQVLAGNGATELIFNWVEQRRPRKALLIQPTFAEYRRALTRYGCEIEPFTLIEQEGFAVTERLLNALDDSLDCLFICTPNNPTGLMPEPMLLGRLVELCHRYEIDMFVDESFIDFLPDTPGLTKETAHYQGLFLLRSLTKFYAIPGLRLGYLLSSDTMRLDAIRERREPWTINALAALSAEVLFQDVQYAQLTYEWLAREQQYLYRALSEIPSLKVFRSQANFLFFKILAAGLDLQSALMTHGILIRHCANYPGLNQDFYRVAIRSHQENQRLISALLQVSLHG